VFKYFQIYLFAVFVATELITPVVIRQRFYNKPKILFYLLCVAHAAISIWFWVLFIETKTYSGQFDAPSNVWRIMQIKGIMAAVTIPRIIIIITHFVGKFLKRNSWLEND
jgi:hypothetical protein